MTTINNHEVHNSGCSFQHESNQKDDIVFGIPDKYDTLSLCVYSEFEDIPESTNYFQLLGIDKIIDYLSFHSLN